MVSLVSSSSLVNLRLFLGQETGAITLTLGLALSPGAELPEADGVDATTGCCAFAVIGGFAAYVWGVAKFCILKDHVGCR